MTAQGFAMLFPVEEDASPEWEAAYNKLMEDAWLRRKVVRADRLIEQWHYLKRYAPTLWDANREVGLVIDLGCGPGELLEIARSLGHSVLGVDAVEGYGGMGDAYLALSKLWRERQCVETHPGDFWHWVHKGPHDASAVLINSRGSWEQMFSGHMIGEPHHIHQDASRLTWNIHPGLEAATISAIRAINDSLRPGGAFVCHFNGAQNHTAYRELFDAVARTFGLVSTEKDRLFVGEKP